MSKLGEHCIATTSRVEGKIPHVCGSKKMAICFDCYEDSQATLGEERLLNKKEIRQLRTTITRLEGEVTAGHTLNLEMNREVLDWQIKAEKAEADSERYRKVLEKIFDDKEHQDRYNSEDVKYIFASAYHEFRKFAKQVLNDIDTEGKGKSHGRLFVENDNSPLGDVHTVVCCQLCNYRNIVS